MISENMYVCMVDSTGRGEGGNTRGGANKHVNQLYLLYAVFITETSISEKLVTNYTQGQMKSFSYSFLLMICGHWAY